MSPALAGTVTVISMLVMPLAGRWRSPWRAAIIIAAAAGSIAAIGSPELAGSGGFLIEPVRAWGTIAIVVAMAAASLLRTAGEPRWGLVAAGACLALLSGHAAVALGAMSLADWVCAVGSLGERPRTLHAAITSRGMSLLLLAADAVLAIAVLAGSAGAAEPLAVQGGILATVGIGARMLALLAIDPEYPPLVPVLLGMPLLAPLAWLNPTDARASVLVAAAVAAVAAHRFARSGARPWIGVTLVGLAVVLAGTGDPGMLTLMPLIAVVVVAGVVLPDLVRGGGLMLAACAGGILLAVAHVTTSTLLDSQDRWRELAGAALIITFGGLTVGAFGIVRATPERERGELWRIPVGVVVGGLVALIAVFPGPVIDATSAVILDARIRDPLAGEAARIDAWIPIVTAATLSVIALLGMRSVRRRSVPVPEGPLRRVVPASEPVVSRTWIRTTLVIAGIAKLTILMVLARSIMRGWL